MDDLISRQEALDALAEQMPTPYTPDGSHPADEQIFQVQEVYADCITTIKLLPTIQPERKKGEWLPDNNNAYEMRFVCSCCKESEVVPTIGFTKYRPLWDFCPNCGARMKGEI